MSIGGISGIGAVLHQMQMETMRQAMFKQLDQDGDGSISKGDIQGLAQDIARATGDSINVDKVFTTLDADQDGVVDQSDYDAAMARFENTMQNRGGPQKMGNGPPPGPPPEAASANPLQDLFKTLDQDGDGLISQSEFEAALAQLARGTGASDNLSQLFAELDANQDGVIDQSEQEAAAEQLAQLHPGHRPPPGPPPPEGSSESTQALFERLDQDGDGLISQSELEAALAERTQMSGKANEEEKETAAAAASSTTDLESGTSAFMQKLLEDFIYSVQNDFYLQSASDQKGVKTYA